MVVLMLVDPSFSRRLTAWILFLILGGVLLATGYPSSSLAATHPGMDLIIFVDFSGSIRKEDKKSFEQDLTKRVIPSLSAGDRILIAPITEKTLTDFRPLIEVDFPPKPSFNGFMQNAMTYNRQVKEVDTEVARLKEELVVQVAGMFKQYFASPRTDIFNAIVLAQKLFSDEGKARVLVLMSDMVEDSQPYNFYRLQWGPDTVEKLLGELDANGLVPDLSGVCLYVSGASADTAEMAHRVGNFWATYFQRAKANMDSRRYAHVLLHWPPSKACPVQ